MTAPIRLLLPTPGGRAERLLWRHLSAQQRLQWLLRRYIWVRARDTPCPGHPGYCCCCHGGWWKLSGRLMAHFVIHDDGRRRHGLCVNFRYPFADEVLAMKLMLEATGRIFWQGNGPPPLQF